MGFERLSFKLRDLRLRLVSAPVIHCLGDSHVSSYEYVSRSKSLESTLFRFCVVQGATATGLPNPASQTMAGPIFQEYLKKVPLSDYVLTCLGEVDCGFVIWYRSRKYGERVEEQFEKAINNYTAMIVRMIAEGRKVIVSSTPLPTIKDGQDWGEVASLRREVQATLKERTNLTISFNNKMMAFCSERNLSYINMQSFMLNKETGLIDDRFVNPNIFDHHLNPEPVGEIIVKELRRLGFK